MSIDCPRLQSVPAKKTTVAAFTGYDRRPLPREGGLPVMHNLSAEEYPRLVTRKPRGIVRTLTNPHGLYALNGLIYCDGTTLYHDGTAVAGLTLTDTDKCFAAIGSKLVILPDKIVYDTVTHGFEPMERTNVAQGNTSVRVSLKDGGAYESVTVSAEPPADPKNGDIWLDTSGEEHVMKLFSSLYGTWQSMAVTYLRLGFAGIGEGLRAGDAVSVDGFADAKLNGTFVIASRDTDWLVVAGLVDAAFDETATVTVRRNVPALDHITECGNRLWGTCNAEHCLYASAPGEPAIFYRYRGIADDAYAVTVGSPGDFTGIANYGGTVVAFKENRLVRVTGTVPARFRVSELVVSGMAEGGDAAVIDNVLYYTGTGGLWAFAGTTPVSVSQALGEWHLTFARLGAMAERLYLSGTANGETVMLVYDSVRGIFSREDATAVSAFAAHNGDLYALAGTTLFSVGGTLPAGIADANAHAEEDISFWAETGDLLGTSTAEGTVAGVTLRARAEEGALMRVELLVPGEPVRELMRFTPGRALCQSARVLPRRCCSARLRFSGCGRVRIDAMTIRAVSHDG